MVSTEPATVRLQSIRRSPAQARILAVALNLFAEHGVSGTSLQMIADGLGVTKAAVYHKFNTKSEIVLAVAENEFAKLEAVLETAEILEPRVRAREMLLLRVIDMAIERRRWVSVLQSDPVMIRLLADHEPLLRITERVYGLLLDGATGPEARVAAAVMSAAIGGTLVHPLVADLDDETLRRNLLRITRRIFDVDG